jgi:pyruvate dehydrogenase E2 component (dihydrolipoamide acetyltransferase)
MPVEVILPKVDMDMATGRISRWFVEEGAAIRKGELLFEIETDKAAMEVDAPAAGTLRDIVAAAGVDIPVGQAVAWIYAEGEAYAGGAAGLAAARPRATPLARRLARRLNLDLAKLAGSGPKGRIQARDIEPASAAAAPAPRQARQTALLQTAMRSSAKAGAHDTTALWLRRGEGVPVVLIHGFGAETAAWRPLLSAFDPEVPILSIDLPGHGAAVGAAADSFDDLVAHAEAELAAHGIAVAHLAGHSLGGAVATAVAAGLSVEARSLFLLAPAGFGPEINGGFVEGFAAATGEAALRVWMRELVADPAALSDSFVRATQRVRADGRLAAAQTRLAALLFSGGTQLFSVRGLLNKLAVPTKVIAGTADRVIPHSQFSGLPGTVGIHRFGGLGHMPQLEDRASVARLLRELVR